MFHYYNLKSRHSWKASIFEINLSLVLKMLNKCQNNWEIFLNFVAYLEILNFKTSDGKDIETLLLHLTFSKINPLPFSIEFKVLKQGFTKIMDTYL